MNKTHKNIVDVQLDLLEMLFCDISDKDEQSKTILERVRLYREKLNNNDSSLLELDYQVRNLTVNLALYLSGEKEDVFEDLSSFPKSNVSSEEVQNHSQPIDIKDSTKKASALFAFEQTYIEISRVSSQEIEQLFSKTKYKLMKELLIKGELSKAKLLTHTFNNDLRVYIIKRLNDKREELASQGRYKEAYEVLEYISSKKDDISAVSAPERSLEFWEKIIRVETSSLNYTLPKIKIRKFYKKQYNQDFEGSWKEARLLQRISNDKYSTEQIIEKETDSNCEQDETLTSLLGKIRELRQKMLYFELGLRTVDPKQRDKHK